MYQSVQYNYFNTERHIFYMIKFLPSTMVIFLLSEVGLLLPPHSPSLLFSLFSDLLSSSSPPSSPASRLIVGDTAEQMTEERDTGDTTSCLTAADDVGEGCDVSFNGGAGGKCEGGGRDVRGG
jgi:hypothetical protein